MAQADCGHMHVLVYVHALAALQAFPDRLAIDY